MKAIWTIQQRGDQLTRGESAVAKIEVVGYLIKVVVPPRLLGKVDYTKVATAFTGYVPAFAREAIDRAMRYSIARNGGTPDEVTTADLVNAAQGLRAQHGLMESAAEGSAPVTLDGALTARLEEVLNRAVVRDSDLPLRVSARDVARVGTDD